jgi:hypothetical protein
VSVSDLHNPMIGLPILLQENMCPGPWSWGKNKPLADTWMWNLGLRPRNSFSGNTQIWFLLQCGCPRFQYLWFRKWLFKENHRVLLYRTFISILPLCFLWVSVTPVIEWKKLLSTWFSKKSSLSHKWTESWDWDHISIFIQPQPVICTYFVYEASKESE